MTYKDLAIKILNLDTDFLNKEVSEQELFNLVDNSDKLDLEIETYYALPCSLEVFKINGKDADLEDFGTTCTCGDCMLSECCSEFEKIKPTSEVLQKYGISGSQFYQICAELKEKLHVEYCGWCS